ncbi:hypothetical protein [Mycobacterium paraintracellulare]
MRFNIGPILAGHWRGLSVVDKHGQLKGPDYAARITLVVGPTLVGVAIWHWKTTFNAPGALLSGFALLSGVLLTVFAQLAGMRLKLNDQDDESDRRQVLKDSIDEAVAHVLVAAILGLACSVLVVVAMTMGGPTQPVVAGVPAILLGAFAAYEVLVLLIVVRGLYSAYVRVNEVSRDLSGFTRVHSPSRRSRAA